jgi:hypothetical protein
VICEYRLLADRSGACERVDVRFNSNTIVWGAPVREFEAVNENG